MPKVPVAPTTPKMTPRASATVLVYLQKPLAGNTALRKEAIQSSCGFQVWVTLRHGWMVYARSSTTGSLSIIEMYVVPLVCPDWRTS